MFQNDFGPYDSQCEKSLTEYARVWLCAWKPEGALEARNGSLIGSFRIEEEPNGIIGFKNLQLHPMWIKIDKKWIPLFHHCKGNPFVELHIISKVEYETDIAFGLFKELRTTHRPIRTWFSKNFWHIYTWNMIGMVVLFLGALSSFGMSKEAGDVSFSVGMLLVTILALMIITSLICGVLKTIILPRSH